MVLSGLRRDVETGRDLGVRVALPHQVEHLELARAEAGDGPFLVLGRAHPCGRTQLAQEGGRPIGATVRADALEDGGRGSGFVDRPRALARRGERLGQRDAGRGLEERSIAEDRSCLVEAHDRLLVLAPRRGDASGGERRLALDRGTRPSICERDQLVGSVVGGGEVAERDLGFDESSQQLRRPQDVALHLLEAAPSGGRRELGFALQQAKPSDRLAGRDAVFIGGEQRRRLVDASLLESHPREVACRLEAVARVPRRGR